MAVISSLTPTDKRRINVRRTSLRYDRAPIRRD